MKRVRLFKLPFRLLFLFVIVLWLSSCRSTRNLTTANLKSLSAGRLIKNVERNALDYEYLSIRRINCQFSDGESKTNFRVNLRAQKDENILLSISKLTLPVGRILLTPDSVIYVNYMEKNFFRDDYSYLSRLLGADVDFKTVQSILSNDYFSSGNERTTFDEDSFESTIESGSYVLQSEAPEFLLTIEDDAPVYAQSQSVYPGEALVFQKMIIQPQNFAVTNLEIIDAANNRSLHVDFSDFTTVARKNFPGAIEMVFNSPRNEIALTTKMSGFSTEKISSFSINIPESYEQIYVN